MSKKHKKVYAILKQIEHIFILVSSVSGCFSISAFPSLLGIPIEITSLTIRLKTYEITAEINKYKLIVKKKKKA